MTRRVFIVASVASMMLCIASVSLAVRSCCVQDSWYATTARSSWSCSVSRGRMWLAWNQMPGGGLSVSHTSARPPGPIQTPDGWLGAMGFFWDDLRSPVTGAARLSLVLPMWLLLLAAAILPELWLARALRGRGRALSGECPGCGYDLRASTERCPECGMPIPQRQGAPA